MGAYQSSVAINAFHVAQTFCINMIENALSDQRSDSTIQIGGLLRVGMSWAGFW